MCRCPDLRPKAGDPQPGFFEDLAPQRLVDALAEFDAAGRDLEGAGIDRISVRFPAHLNQDLDDALALPLDDCRDDRHWEGEIRRHGAIRLHEMGASPGRGYPGTRKAV